MPVRLRGHHFLCILTYRGHGYTPAFVANMTRVVGAIAAGRSLVLVDGPDDICNGFTAACRAQSDHDCGLADTREMDRIAQASVEACLPGLAGGGEIMLTKDRLDALRAAFADGSLRAACRGCSWHDFCSTIAGDGFSKTELAIPG
jgi:hypothetical protein